jgi:hypothetical protein
MPIDRGVLFGFRDPPCRRRAWPDVIGTSST